MRTIGTGIYESLGVRRVINGMGNVTLLGGSTLAPKVLAAMEEANGTFVDMEELLAKSGQAVAGILGAEAALVTCGCFSAMVMGAAAIMVGKDPDRIARLPDTSGLKNEFLIQKPTRYHYDRAVTVPGGKLLEVGGDRETTAAQLEAAIGARTAGVLYAARSEGNSGVLSLTDVVRIAKNKGVAVLVDAAAEIYPLDRMTWVAGKSGADLVCFGAKYLGSANSTGIICGRKGLIEAVVAQGFISFETADTHTVGRGYKVDRQEIVGTLVALREWFAADHAARLAAQEQRVQTIMQGLAGLPHVKTERLWPRKGAWLQVRVTFDEAKIGKSAAAVVQALRAGDPSVRVRLEEGQIVIAVNNLKEGEDRIVVDRLRRELS